MIPPRSHPQWKRLVQGEIQHSFKAFVGAMCIARLVRFVKMEGGTPEAVDMAIEDAFAFFSRQALALEEDIQAIFGPEDDHAAQP